MICYAIIRGLKLVISSIKPEAIEISKILEKYQVNHCFLSTTYATSLVKLVSQNPELYKFPSLKSVAAGGSPIPTFSRVGFKEYLSHVELSDIYGLSEAGALLISSEYTSNMHLVGKPICNIKGRVVDRARCNLNPYEKGEISFKPQFPFLGYFGEPEKTKKMIDSDGWIYTGLFMFEFKKI
jgi:acyl-coenzyme A synthetase/AMP-(fatty) acid ligase